jgi:rhodanese-related sulfurtransferase
MAPEEAARRVASGEAVLIDVREPAEWTDGVAEPALLLPLSDLRGKRVRSGKQALEQHKDKEFILYCRTGNRSGTAASILAKEGFRVANAGGFSAWRKAGAARAQTMTCAEDCRFASALVTEDDRLAVVFTPGGGRAAGPKRPRLPPLRAPAKRRRDDGPTANPPSLNQL